MARPIASRMTAASLVRVAAATRFSAAFSDVGRYTVVLTGTASVTVRQDFIPLAITRMVCGQGAAGTFQTIACWALLNFRPTGVRVFADLRAFGGPGMTPIGTCGGCGEIEYDLDLHTPPDMAPGVYDIPFLAVDPDGHTATATGRFQVLPR